MSDSSEPIPLTAAFDRLFSAVGEVGCGATEAPVFRAPADLLMHMNRLAVTHSLVTHAAARDVHPTDGNRRLLDDLEACAAARGRLHPALVVTPTQQWERDGIAESRHVALPTVPASTRA